MERHLYDRSLQTSGSACLYYVVEMFQNESDTMLAKYNDYLKRLLIAILAAMNTHLQHPAVRRQMRILSIDYDCVCSDDSKWSVDNLSNTNAFTEPYCEYPYYYVWKVYFHEFFR